MRVSAKSLPLWIEFVVLYALVPLALWQRWLPPAWIVVSALLYVAGVLAIQKWRDICKPLIPKERVPYRRELKRVLMRFAIVAPMLALLVFLLTPQTAFTFPQEQTAVWGMLMLTYPIYSVLPQELIYRSFFFWRYRRLVRPRTLFIALNAAAFAVAHLFIGHWITIAVTLVAGAVFAYTYLRTRTLHVVWVEHALYGNLLFTIGMGPFLHKASAL